MSAIYSGNGGNLIGEGAARRQRPIHYALRPILLRHIVKNRGNLALVTSDSALTLALTKAVPIQIRQSIVQLISNHLGRRNISKNTFFSLKINNLIIFYFPSRKTKLI